MADDYARSIARVVVGQLAEQAGYESAHETAIDVLSELLLRYLEELSAGSHAYAELATRSEINAYDALMAIEDTGGTTVDDLTKYIGSLSSVSDDMPNYLAMQRCHAMHMPCMHTKCVLAALVCTPGIPCIRRQLGPAPEYACGCVPSAGGERLCAHSGAVPGPPPGPVHADIRGARRAATAAHTFVPASLPGPPHI